MGHPFLPFNTYYLTRPSLDPTYTNDIQPKIQFSFFSFLYSFFPSYTKKLPHHRLGVYSSRSCGRYLSCPTLVYFILSFLSCTSCLFHLCAGYIGGNSGVFMGCSQGLAVFPVRTGRDNGFPSPSGVPGSFIPCFGFCFCFNYLFFLHKLSDKLWMSVYIAFRKK